MDQKLQLLQQQQRAKLTKAATSSKPAHKDKAQRSNKYSTMTELNSKSQGSLSSTQDEKTRLKLLTIMETRLHCQEIHFQKNVSRLQRRIQLYQRLIPHVLRQAVTLTPAMSLLLEHIRTLDSYDLELSESMLLPCPPEPPQQNKREFVVEQEVGDGSIYLDPIEPDPETVMALESDELLLAEEEEDEEDDDLVIISQNRKHLTLNAAAAATVEDEDVIEEEISQPVTPISPFNDHISDKLMEEEEDDDEVEERSSTGMIRRISRSDMAADDEVSRVLAGRMANTLSRTYEENDFHWKDTLKKGQSMPINTRENPAMGMDLETLSSYSRSQQGEHVRNRSTSALTSSSAGSSRVRSVHPLLMSAHEEAANLASKANPVWEVPKQKATNLKSRSSNVSAPPPISAGPGMRRKPSNASARERTSPSISNQNFKSRSAVTSRSNPDGFGINNGRASTPGSEADSHMSGSAAMSLPAPDTAYSDVLMSAAASRISVPVSAMTDDSLALRENLAPITREVFSAVSPAPDSKNFIGASTAMVSKRTRGTSQDTKSQLDYIMTKQSKAKPVQNSVNTTANSNYGRNNGTGVGAGYHRPTPSLTGSAVSNNSSTALTAREKRALMGTK